MNLILILLFSSVLIDDTFSRPLYEIKFSKEIRFGFESGNPPYSFLLRKQLAGLEVELARRVARSQGWNIVLQTVTRTGAAKALESDVIDVFGSAQIGDGFDGLTEMGSNLFCSSLAVVSLDGEKRTAEALKTHDYVVSNSFGQADLAEKNKLSLKIVYREPSDEQALETAITKNLFWAVDLIGARFWLKERHMSSFTVGERLIEFSKSWRYRKQDLELMNIVERSIQSIVTDKKWDFVEKEFLGKESRVRVGDCNRK